MMIFRAILIVTLRPVISVSRESNELIVEWTDNDKLLRGAFPDLFLFGQGIPNQLPTHQHWKHFALYYDGRFANPLFIPHGFNQLQRASCIRTSARITRKNAATLSSLGILANSEAFRKHLVWTRDHPNSKGAKSLNQSCLTYFQWYDQRFHRVHLNVQQLDQN
jgi:hypothetical protein